MADIGTSWQASTNLLQNKWVSATFDDINIYISNFPFTTCKFPSNGIQSIDITTDEDKLQNTYSELAHEDCKLYK